MLVSIFALLLIVILLFLNSFWNFEKEKKKVIDKIRKEVERR